LKGGNTDWNSPVATAKKSGEIFCFIDDRKYFRILAVSENMIV
jgi:hypothetical protein